MSYIELCRSILWHTVPYCLPLLGVVLALVVLERFDLGLAGVEEVQGE